MKRNRWQFWIDVGGTFTDCLAVDPSGIEHFHKLLSSGVVKGRASVGSSFATDSKLIGVPNEFWTAAQISLFDQHGEAIFESPIASFFGGDGVVKFAKPLNAEILESEYPYEIRTRLPAPILAIHQMMGIPIATKLNPCDVFLGTTKGTNALLTRTGARTGLVTSLGFKDFLTIGDQTRPHLFELTIKKPEPLFSTSIEVDERVLFDGTIERKPDSKQIRSQLLALKNDGIESIAVCLMHGYRFPDHERIVADVAREIGYKDVRISSDVAPLIKLIPRGHTTVLDAYLNPVLGKYLDDVQTRLGPESRLKLMTSDGSLTGRSTFSGKDSVLSGPAGGAVGAARISQQIGFGKSIAFDMGGTSTDVSRFDGNFEFEYETKKAGVQIMTPVMKIETVAAGGGSICAFDGTRLTVGPESAGAFPGPACYGSNGPLTVTDINLFLNRLDVSNFPIPLDRSAAEAKLNELAGQINRTGPEKSLTEIAHGFLRIANHSMASAIRTISVARGYDPKNYLLVSFGGAGGQHCCEVADQLGIENILVHPKSSVLSAYGIQLADHSLSLARSIGTLLDESAIHICNNEFHSMTIELHNRFDEDGIESKSLVSKWSFDLRYRGTENTINIERARIGELRREFVQRHQNMFGYSHDRKIEIVAVRAKVILAGHRLATQSIPEKRQPIAAKTFTKFFSNDELIEGGNFEWSSLPIGAEIAGPAVVFDKSTSTIVDFNWTALVLEDRQLLITRKSGKVAQPKLPASFESADPIELELFNRSFQCIAEQMGFVLKNTSVSVNVKERLDFSCALFSSTGELVVNAPHIPVHLGAMSETVKATIRLNSKVNDGDVFVTNDPYEGGSHLPDVTVLSPVFVDNEIAFWVASRAHHAELGGISPGSMPANATRLGEEGILIQNFKLIESGQERFDGLKQLLTQSEFPSRNPEENIADIAAQVAANHSGAVALLELIGLHSHEKVKAYTQHIRNASESNIRDLIRSLDLPEFTFSDCMDDGTKINVCISKRNDSLRIDFTGSEAVHAGNLNANIAIVSSAIIYVLRCMIDQDIPLNGGVLEPVNISMPKCFLNPEPAEIRQDSPAVVGGNVETSQRIVDVLMGAFGLAAAGQGTMNNWLVGDETFGYYETVGGGSGATAIGNGVDAVHCHMSNTRLTDPEILESRYPMVLRKFLVRADSGGKGKFNGGNGMIREIEFTSPLTLSILTSRRTTEPYGVAGGQPGQSGVNVLIRKSSEEETLPSQCERKVQPGDRLLLMTPGGGGFG